MRFRIFATAVTVALFIAVHAHADDGLGFAGKYSKKVGGDAIKLGIYPTAGKNSQNEVQVFFSYEEPGGEELAIDGMGRLQGNKVTLYYYTYRLNVTLNKGGTADILLEQSCGDHRLYPGYGHYSEDCDPEVAKLAPHSKGLKKEADSSR